jgi:hypothetical protein
MVNENLTRISYHERGRAGFYRLRKNSSGQALSATPACAGAARFGVRQLAAALARASLLAGSDALGCNPRERARGEESGSKLPHSKASLRMTAETSFSAACKTPPFRPSNSKGQNVARNPD